jgi:hypothetical protein
VTQSSCQRCLQEWHLIQWAGYILDALYIMQCSSLQGSFHFREYKKVAWHKAKWIKAGGWSLPHHYSARGASLSWQNELICDMEQTSCRLQFFLYRHHLTWRFRLAYVQNAVMLHFLFSHRHCCSCKTHYCLDDIDQDNLVWIPVGEYCMIIWWQLSPDVVHSVLSTANMLEHDK